MTMINIDVDRLEGDIELGPDGSGGVKFSVRSNGATLTFLLARGDAEALASGIAAAIGGDAPRDPYDSVPQLPGGV